LFVIHSTGEKHLPIDLGGLYQVRNYSCYHSVQLTVSIQVQGTVVFTLEIRIHLEAVQGLLMVTLQREQFQKNDSELRCEHAVTTT
jgi:hypothetical protein